MTKDKIVSAEEFAQKHANKNFEDNEKYLSEEIPKLLKETMLMQGRMIVACLSTNAREKLNALAKLLGQGVTHATARKEVDRILKEMLIAARK